MCYDEEQDLVFCHMCVKAYKEKKLTTDNLDLTSIANDFCF